MKATVKFIVASMLIMGLVGCATTSPPPTTAKVKCPTCGYEFAPFAIGP